MRPLLLLSALLLACSARADQLDDAIEREMARRHVPGGAVVVLQHGKIVRERGYGLANVEHGVAATPHTMFQSGSIGKTFTAALILLLAEDGKLGLDDPVSRHLPEAPRWIGIVAEEIGDAGPLQAVELLERREDGVLRLARYRFRYRDETMIVSMTLSAAGTIERLGIGLE
ncbi:beta-lactamase family protein [Massilia sp. G4R7]|uniref:Beta-lactamase family protein n=1 Tax=Massilia phyllostachyos TaxID=2898585 RepID=A0ABS8QBJ5_9BURK|nr:serine hydrolase domain-containing protein [Massilia phyllostachyos]MCD2519111.1 beta-lactamase family protein [Massilia phyllostachyos]